jgi:hypothetical protein
LEANDAGISKVRNQIDMVFNFPRSVVRISGQCHRFRRSMKVTAYDALGLDNIDIAGIILIQIVTIMIITMIYRGKIKWKRQPKSKN